MTLVGLSEDRSILPTMLTVQQQHHHHHHRHHTLHIPTTAAAQIHRGNVIVSASGVGAGGESKVALLAQQQHQQPSQPQSHHGCKKSKMYGQSTPYGTVAHQPASVARRNARERNRVKQVNNGFAELRERIPQSVAQALGGSTAGTHGGSRAGSKKLSKVETLRMAVEYIRSLQRLLEEHDGGDMNHQVVSSTSPVSSSISSISSSSSTLMGSESDHCSVVELRLHSGNGDMGSDLVHQQHHYHHHQRQNASPTAFMPTPCSEASSSPTPSFVSEASSAGSQGYGTTNQTLYAMHPNGNEYYEPMTPEDEELLDVISMWQQNQ